MRERARAGGAKTKDVLGDWHHASCDVAVGIHATVEAILQRQAIEKILDHLGLDPQPPPRAQARGQMAF